MKPTQLSSCRKNILGLLLILASLTNSKAQIVLDVFFSNFGPGFAAPIYNADEVTPLAGANFCAELIYDTTPLGTPGFAVASPSTQFVVPGLPGYFGDGTTRKITGFDDGAKVTLRVRAWDSNTGLTFDQATLRGISDSFQLTVSTIDPAQPPPMAQWLSGLHSFSLQAVPEPAESLVALGIGCLAFAFYRRSAHGKRSHFGR